MRMTKLFKSTVLVALSVFCGIAFAQSQSEMPRAAVYIAKYGKLYDWNTARTVCPSGRGLPSRQEWEHLVAAS